MNFRMKDELNLRKGKTFMAGESSGRGCFFYEKRISNKTRNGL